MSHDVPHYLTVDGRVDPFGIGTVNPRFSWLPPGDDRCDAYELEITDADGGPVWSSELEAGPGPSSLTYAGPALVSRTRYFWRVRGRKLNGEWMPRSETAWFETGLLDAGDWRAQWITDGPEVRRRDAPTETLYFRSHLELPAHVRRARAYASALGMYRLFVGDADVTGDALVPRWTPLDEEVEYQVYDLTDLLRAGRNEIGVIVADGRYRGHLGYVDRRAVYGTRLAVIVQIEAELDDGSIHRFVSDESWRVGHGVIRSADPIHGERVDLLVPTDWLEPNHEPVDSRPAQRHVGHVTRRLIAEDVDRMRVIGTRDGTVTVAPSGAQIVDFGQNFTGTARIQLPAAPGTLVTLSYGEVLTPDGELNTTYLSERKPKEWFQRDEIVLGERPELYSASFAIRGFRYLAVEGLPHPLQESRVQAVQIGTPMRETGWFSCSDPRLERLWQNARWSMLSNYLDTATDCPTRERSGWTGEAQVFGPTAATLFDVRAFQTRYLHNLALEQHEDGRIPPYIPSEVSALLQKNPKQKWTLSSAGWGDVSVLLPWTLYTYYGDPGVLATQYPAAKAWVGFLERTAARRGLRPRGGRRVGAQERFIVDSGFHFGEWLRPGETGLRTQLHNLLRVPAVVATAYLARSARLLAQTAEVLAEHQDQRRYDALAADVQRAWHAAFVTHAGSRIGEDRQDDYVRALAFDLLPEPERPRAAARLVELIEAKDDHLDTGFLSTSMLLPVLCAHGRPDVAYRLLMQDTAPSWLFPVSVGATTIWEKWDGNDASGHASQSQNHYAHGSVATFLHEYVAGLRPGAPGWRSIIVDPVIGGGLTHASSRVETVFGTARSAWRIDGDMVRLKVTVPAGTTARVRVGNTDWRVVEPGDHELNYPMPVLESAA